VYDRTVPDPSAFVDEVANELATWPGVLIERRADGAAIVKYREVELGLLYPDRGLAELPVLEREHDVLIEHGEAEPAELADGSSGVSHSIRGPADITATLELFDRRYRDVRGEDDPYTSEDPGYPERPAGPALASRRRTERALVFGDFGPRFAQGPWGRESEFSVGSAGCR
jgi:hypothetical protein